MSIEGIANYEHYNTMQHRPEWVKLERIDFCDQDVYLEKRGVLRHLISMIKGLSK